MGACQLLHPLFQRVAQAERDGTHLGAALVLDNVVIGSDTLMMALDEGAGGGGSSTRPDYVRDLGALVTDWLSLVPASTDPAVAELAGLARDMESGTAGNAARCLAEYERIMDLRPTDGAWEYKGRGGFGCVGVQDPATATKFFTSYGDARKEVDQTARIDDLDPDHRFHLKMSSRVSVLPTARFKRAEDCSLDFWKLPHVPPFAPAVRMQAASFTMAGWDPRAHPMSEEQLVLAVQPLFEGLRVMKEAGVGHFDIKPENIMFLEAEGVFGMPPSTIRLSCRPTRSSRTIPSARTLRTSRN
jgi:hypothetical protein